MLNEYQKICYKIFGKFSSRSIQKESVKLSLERAHLRINSEAYISYVWMNSFIAALIGIAIIMIYFSFFQNLPKILSMIVIPSPLLLALLTYSIFMLIPESTANKRGKAIDRDLPYAINFMAAMSSAGVNPDKIFEGLASQPVYGEVQREASWIHRDIAVFGRDVVTAIKDAIDRSPSTKFSEFLQGAITTIKSGGYLKSYFMAKADQYMRENRRNQKDFLKTLGVMAESYVTVVVTAPLLALIMFSIMGMIGGGGLPIRPMMYLLIFMMLPICHVAFCFVIRSMTPKE